MWRFSCLFVNPAYQQNPKQHGWGLNSWGLRHLEMSFKFCSRVEIRVWHSYYKGRREPEFDSVVWMQGALLEGKCLPGERSECDWTANCPLPPFPSRRHILFFNEMTSERIIKTRWILRVSFQFPQVPFNLASDIILCITVKRPAAFEVWKPRCRQNHDGKI